MAPVAKYAWCAKHQLNHGMKYPSCTPRHPTKDSNLSQPIDKLRAKLRHVVGNLLGYDTPKDYGDDVEPIVNVILKLVEAEIVRELERFDKTFDHDCGNREQLHARISTLKGEALKQPNQSNQDREV